MKKQVKVIITIIIIIVSVLGISTISSKVLSTYKEPKKEQPIIKESPYTLEELYAIVEQPAKFYELNKLADNDLAYTFFHFYDYFNKSTPVKVAKTVKRNEDKDVIEVLEFEYLSYDEYMKRMESAHQHEKEELEWCEENKEELLANNEYYECTIDYRYFVALLIGID